jgi:hypothetical protein
VFGSLMDTSIVWYVSPAARSRVERSVTSLHQATDELSTSDQSGVTESVEAAKPSLGANARPPQAHNAATITRSSAALPFRVPGSDRPKPHHSNHGSGDGGRLAAGNEPAGRGGDERHADDREGEVEDGDVT